VVGGAGGLAKILLLIKVGLVLSFFVWSFTGQSIFLQKTILHINISNNFIDVDSGAGGSSNLEWNSTFYNNFNSEEECLGLSSSFVVHSTILRWRDGN
jgi:hypothetical protein